MNEVLQKYLDTGDVGAAVGFVLRLSPGERRAVAPHVQKLCKGIWFAKEGPELARAVVAVVTSTPSELRKFVKFRLPVEVVDALAQVQPDWLDEAAEVFASIDPLHFDVARELVRRGLSRRPTHENYILGLIRDTRFGEHPFDADPGLLEWEVWRLFEVEGGGEGSLAARDKYTQRSHSWTEAFLRQLTAGKLPRARLIDATLDSLERDFAPFRAGWFSRFHTELGLSHPELLARRDRYLRLLHSAVPATVTLALNTIAALHAQEPIPAELLIEALEPVMLSRHKVTALEAIRLLRSVAAREPGRASGVARLLGQALAHEAVDVQRAALDGLDGLPPAFAPEIRTLVVDRADGLAATLRARSRRWLGDEAAPHVGPKTHEERAPAASPPITPLHPTYAVPPIETFEELLHELTSLVEDVSDVDRVERALDGLARLGAHRPADFAERIGPLAKRARKRTPSLVGEPLLAAVVHLARAWTAPAGQALSTLHEAQALEAAKAAFSLVPVLMARAQTIARGLDAARTAPLLGAPTHRGGWIAPGVLVDRVLDVSCGEPDAIELSLALLRLAPEGREEALTKLGRARAAGEYVAALTYALGGDAEIGPTASWWAAAARARAPNASDAAVDARHPGLGPDAALVASYDWAVESRKSENGEHTFHDLRVSIRPDLTGLARLPSEWRTHRQGHGRHTALPLPMIAVRRYEFAPAEKVFLRWLATTWPGGSEAYAAAFAEQLFGNIDWWEARWEQIAVYEVLGAPFVRFGPMATLVLAIGLGAKEPGQSTASCDAAISALGTGTLTGAQLGATLLRLRGSGAVKLKRWASTLKSVASTSPVHAEHVATAIQACLRGEPSSAPRDEGSLVALLLELLAELERPLWDPLAREYLQGSRHRKAFAAHVPRRG